MNSARLPRHPAVAYLFLGRQHVTNLVEVTVIRRWSIFALIVVEVLSGACRRTGLQPAEGYVDVPGGRIWYRIVGGGTRTPLVLLHGGPGAPSYYLNPLAALADERPVILCKSLTQTCRAGCDTGEPAAINNAIGYAKSYSRSHDAVIRVYDEAGNVIERRFHFLNAE
jgi:hypothetical protein